MLGVGVSERVRGGRSRRSTDRCWREGCPEQLPADASCHVCWCGGGGGRRRGRGGGEPAGGRCHWIVGGNVFVVVLFVVVVVVVTTVVPAAARKRGDMINDHDKPSPSPLLVDKRVWFCEESRRAHGRG